MKKILMSVLASCLVSSAAFAGGYQLSEYSVTNLGRSFGGAGIVGDDYSAIAFNPAGMTLKNTGVQLGGNVVAIRAIGEGQLLDASGNQTASGQGEIRTIALLPHLFAQKQLNERFTIGTGVYVPFGLGTYYKKGWFGATHALNSEINAIDMAAAASVKLTDSVSVGGSLIMEYVDARLTNATSATTESDLNADGWKPGYNIGVMYQPLKDTRFGVTYRSKIVHDIKGPHYLHTPLGTLAGDCGTKLVFPEHVLLSAYQKIGQFGVSAMARWTRWSQFNKLTIKSDAYYQATSGTQQYLPTVDEDWRNVWMVGTGVDYYYNQNWTFRTGLAFDQGAVKRAANRTARVPDSNRWIASVGGSYVTGRWQFDVAYAHMFLKNAHAYNSSYDNAGNVKSTLDAKYSMGINLLGASVQYNF